MLPTAISVARNRFASSTSCAAAARRARGTAGGEALILDTLVFIYVPVFAALPLGMVIGQDAVPLLVNIAQFFGFCLLFERDAVFRGAGPGKRVAGLRVVQAKDGKTPLTYGQGVVRWLSQLIPIFNLFDAFVAYQDPLQRRYGDRWAKTRVLDSERALAKERNKVAQRLVKKGIQPPPEFGMTMEGFAQLV